MATKHAARRILDRNGDTVGYDYRDTVIEKQFYADGPSLFTWVINGFGPEDHTEWNTLTAAKAYIDQTKDETP